MSASLDVDQPEEIRELVLGDVASHAEHTGGDAKLLADLTAHERAQVEFAERELYGESNRSLEPVLALLS